MSKTATRIISIILAAVIFGGAFYLYQSGYFNEEQEPQLEEPKEGKIKSGFEEPVTPVRAMIVNPSSLRDQISVNGSTQSREEVTITSEVPGKITHILFREGTSVQKGTPLVKLDVQELEAQLERLQVQQQLTQKIAERLQGLYEKEGVSLQEYEIARAEADQVTAELALLDVQIAKRTIAAPFDGALGLRQVSEGSYLSPGTAIVNLVSTNPIHIAFSIPEKYSQAVNTGSRITFQLDGSQEVLEARVIAREPNIDENTRSLLLKASAPNPSRRILPGAFAKVTVNLAEYEGALLIPTQAVVPELGGKKVFVYRNGKAEPVAVETGIRKDAYIQVLEGLNPGDTVITTGIMQIRGGSGVNITDLEEIKS